MLVAMWLLGLPWYLDLGASVIVALVSWYVAGIVIRKTGKNYEVGDKVQDYYDDYYGKWKYRKLEDEADAAKYASDGLTARRVGWGIAIGVLTAMFWPTVPAAVMAIGAVAGTGWVVYKLAKGSLFAGDKTASIGQARAEKKAALQALAARADQENSEWLAEKVKEVEREYNALEKTQ